MLKHSLGISSDVRIFRVGWLGVGVMTGRDGEVVTEGRESEEGELSRPRSFLPVEDTSWLSFPCSIKPEPRMISSPSPLCQERIHRYFRYGGTEGAQPSTMTMSNRWVEHGLLYC